MRRRLASVALALSADRAADPCSVITAAKGTTPASFDEACDLQVQAVGSAAGPTPGSPALSPGVSPSADNSGVSSSGLSVDLRAAFSAFFAFFASSRCRFSY